MEVSGQKRSKGSAVKLCSFCEDYDITTCADGFCVKCEVFTCHKCFVKHKGRKSNRDHSLVKVGESHSAKSSIDDTFEACQHHTGKLVEFYCPTHDQVCCGVCIVLNHNGCKLELVQNKAAAFKNSSDFNSMTTEITKYDQQATECAALVKINKQQLPGIYEQFVCDVKAFADEVIERVNTMKESLLDQAKDIMLNEERKMNEIQKEVDGLIAELSRQNEILVSKIDKPNKLFAASVLVKPELKKIQQQLEILQAKNIVPRYSFKRDEVLESTLKEIKEIGQLHEHRQNEQKEETRDRDKANKDLGPKEKRLGPEKKQLGLVKKQPLLERQLLCRNIDVDGDILSYAKRKQSGDGLYISNEDLYVGAKFEIEILAIGRNGSIAIGTVPENYKENLLPGLGSNSRGYHSDGKLCYSGCQQNSKGDKWKVGDRVRITVSTSLFDWTIYFTHNGREIYRIDEWLDMRSNHFAVGMKSVGDQVKVVI